MNIIYHVLGDEYIDRDVACAVAKKLNLRAVDWSEKINGKIIAEGGICVDDDCHCQKFWIHWREEAVKTQTIE